MKTITQTVGMIQGALQTGKEIKHDRYSPQFTLPQLLTSVTPETVSLVTLVFTRLGDLFGAKCKTKGLILHHSAEAEARGEITESFYLWCRKLDGLSKKQIAFGIGQIEAKAAEVYQTGEELWPPSYAEFIGLCNQHHGTQAHRYFDRSKAIENKTQREKRRKLGMEQCGKLRDFLNS